VVLTYSTFLSAKVIQGRMLVWGELRLSPLSTSATDEPIVPAPNDR
jgi:hypothetical protein